MKRKISLLPLLLTIVACERETVLEVPAPLVTPKFKCEQIDEQSILKHESVIKLVTFGDVKVTVETPKRSQVPAIIANDIDVAVQGFAYQSSIDALHAKLAGDPFKSLSLKSRCRVEAFRQFISRVCVLDTFVGETRGDFRNYKVATYVRSNCGLRRIEFKKDLCLDSERCYGAVVKALKQSIVEGEEPDFENMLSSNPEFLEWFTVTPKSLVFWIGESAGVHPRTLRSSSSHGVNTLELPFEDLAYEKTIPGQ